MVMEFHGIPNDGKAVKSYLKTDFFNLQNFLVLICQFGLLIP